MLPPLGQITDDTQGEAINWIEQLTYEGRDVRDRMLESMAESLATYDLTTDANDPSEPALVNDAQNAVIAATDIQTREPPEPTVIPIEEGESGPSYWIGPALMVPPEFTTWNVGPSGEPIPPTSLPEDMVEQFRLAGLERHIITVDDAEVAKFCSTVLKLTRARSGTDRWLRRNVLHNNAKGWQFVWFLHDKYRRLNLLRNVPNSQVYCDLKEDVGLMDWLIIDDILSADEASKAFPDLAVEIADLATTGSIDVIQGGTWSRFTGRFYYRPMVAMRMTWLRDQPIPIEPEEALNLGLVIPAQQLVQVPAVAPEAGMMEMDPDVVAPDLSQTIAIDAPGQYTLPDGTPTAPGDPSWPARYGIREIVQIGRRIVRDRECEDWDIPVSLNQNIPVLGTPYGYGEPHRVRGLQSSKNRLLQSIVDYSDFYRFPPALMSQSMKASLGGVDCVTPGLILTCSDQQYSALGGKANIFMDLPQLPPASTQFLPAITQELDRQTQNAPVLQGYASPNSSGKAIEALQFSASSMVSYKGKTTGDMYYRICRLSLHRLMSTMTPQEAHVMVSRLPIHVEAEILSRFDKNRYDVEIEIQAGNGAAAQKKREQANEDQKMGRISMQSAREMLNLDHWKEETRTQSEQRSAAAMMASVTPQATQPQPQKETP